MNILKNQEKAPIVGVQYVRAIAVFLVMLCHISGIYMLPDMFGQDLLDRIFYKGAIGVDLFFVVSGFIITVVSLHKETLAPRLNLFDYAGKRIARIIPFLWVCVVVYAVVRAIGTGKYDIAPYLTAMFLWPLGELRPNVVWTLRHEALFYIVFAFAFLGKKKRPYLLLLWCLSPFLYSAGQSMFGSPYNEVIDELSRFAFHPVNFTFGCGVLIGMAYQTGKLMNWLPALSLWSAVILMLAVTVLAFSAFTSFGDIHVALLSSLVVIISLLIPVSSGWFSRLVQVIGDASYSIYLIHNLIFLVGGTAWISIIGQKYLAAAFMVMIPTALLGGVIIHYWVERPIVKGAQNVLLRVKRRVEPPTAAMEVPAAKRV